MSRGIGRSKDIMVKEKIFAESYLKGNDPVDCLYIADIPNIPTEIKSARKKADAFKKRMNVAEFIKDKSFDCVQNIFQMANNSKNENVKLKANQDLLDRAGLKGVNVNQNLNVSLNISDEDFSSIMENYTDKNRQYKPKHVKYEQTSD